MGNLPDQPVDADAISHRVVGANAWVLVGDTVTACARRRAERDGNRGARRLTFPRVSVHPLSGLDRRYTLALL